MQDKSADYLNLKVKTLEDEIKSYKEIIKNKDEQIAVLEKNVKKDHDTIASLTKEVTKLKSEVKVLISTPGYDSQPSSQEEISKKPVGRHTKTNKQDPPKNTVLEVQIKTLVPVVAQKDTLKKSEEKSTGSSMDATQMQLSEKINRILYANSSKKIVGRASVTDLKEAITLFKLIGAVELVYPGKLPVLNATSSKDVLNKIIDDLFQQNLQPKSGVLLNFSALPQNSQSNKRKEVPSSPVQSPLKKTK